MKWARLTAPLRRLPDFLVIGAAKAGTSSLYAYMIQHPQISAAFKKEVHYFDRKFDFGHLWYRSFFPMRIRSAGTITGEATPSYLCHPQAAQRIGTSLPRVRLIVLLRNPADRAISHYHHSVSRGADPLSMEEAFAAEGGRIVGELERMKQDPGYYGANYFMFGYRRRGEYLESLKAFESVFGRSRMFIESSEVFFANPAATLKAIFAFLGLDSGVRIPDLRARNVGRSDGAGNFDVRAGLQEHFAPHNRRLYEWLGRDLRWDDVP